MRFAKCKKIVEVEAGYTTLFLLQALTDNAEGMQRIVDLEEKGVHLALHERKNGPLLPIANLHPY